MDKEVRGLGSGGNVARVISAMGIRDWSRAVGIMNVMNNTFTSTQDRIQLLRTLAHARLLPPMVLSQLMLLSGNNMITTPTARGFGSEGLTGLADPGVLPFLPQTRGQRVGRGFGSGGFGSGGF